MVLFDGLVYFLKIEKEICQIHQNYLVALRLYLDNSHPKDHSPPNKVIIS